jgi:hypothetical protein
MHTENDQLIHLEKLLQKLKFVTIPHNDYNTPCIVEGTEDDEEYEGELQILVGDDTLIREKDGKFYIFDMNKPDEEPIWLNETEVLDYYEGKYLAYDFPNFESDSYHLIRGFVKVAKNLLSTLEEKLEERENGNRS